jgi:hypothetical protein
MERATPTQPKSGQAGSTPNSLPKDSNKQNNVVKFLDNINWNSISPIAPD